LTTERDIQEELEEVALELAIRLDPMTEVRELARLALLSVKLRALAERERKALRQRAEFNCDEDEGESDGVGI
jgi:hypothetical protein